MPTIKFKNGVAYRDGKPIDSKGNIQTIGDVCNDMEEDDENNWTDDEDIPSINDYPAFDDDEWGASVITPAIDIIGLRARIVKFSKDYDMGPANNPKLDKLDSFLKTLANIDKLKLHPHQIGQCNFALYCIQKVLATGVVSDLNTATTSITPLVNPLNEILKAKSDAKTKKRNADEDGFVQPSKTAKPNTVTQKTVMETKNSFQVIQPEETLDTEETLPEQQKAEKVYTPKPQPFNFKIDEKWESTYEKICEITGTRYPITKRNDIAVIKPTTIDHFRLIQRHLISEKIPFFGLSIKGERPHKVVIKGLPETTETDFIKNFLIEENFDVLRVVQFRRFDKYSATRIPIDVFMVTLKASNNYESIYKICQMGDYNVRLEGYKNNQVRQCYNCQKYSHSSECCFLPPVCLKCAEGHKTNLCTKPRDQPAKCINCGGPHPANYKGCARHPHVLRATRQKALPTIGNSNSFPEPINDSNFPVPPRTENNSNPMHSKSYGITSGPTYSSIVAGNNKTDLNNTKDLQSALVTLQKIVEYLERAAALCDKLQIKSFDDLITKCAALAL